MQVLRLGSALLATGLLMADDNGVAISGGRKESDRPVRLAGITVGVGYTHTTGPAAWGPWGRPWGWGGWGPAWSFYDPFWWGPRGVPAFWTTPLAGRNLGEVRLETQVKTASVFLDGAYAGTVKDLKSMWLEPGVYQLALRDSGGRGFEKKIYVITGKTLRMRPEFIADKEEAKP